MSGLTYASYLPTYASNSHFSLTEWSLVEDETLQLTGHKKRNVLKSQKQILRMALRDEQERQARELYNKPFIAPCTSTVGVINQLVDHAQFIQDVKKL